MAWYDYISSKEETIITSNVSDTPLIPDFLGHDIVEVVANFDIVINGKTFHIEDLTANKEIVVNGPSFQANDGLFFLTYDNKFLNVRRDTNGR